MRLFGFGLIRTVLSVLMLALAVQALQLCLGSTDTEANAELPFAPGERLVFELRWAAVPAGKAVLEVMPMKIIDGTEVYHFRMTAESNAFVDMFYKVRDRIDSYVIADMSGTIHYRQKQHEGSSKKTIKVQFDRENSTAQYSDGRKTRNAIEILPGTFDPLSVFYYSRLAKFEPDGIIECPISDGKKLVSGSAKIVRKETIQVPGGKFETYLIEPELKDIGGVFRKSKDAKIQLWVTADERRLPVKIASKVSVGRFIGELITIEKGQS